MKKNFKFLAITICLVLSFALLAGCGGTSSTDSTSGDATSVAGNTYVFESYTVDDEDQTETITAMFAEQKLTFNDDGTVVQTTTWSDAMAEQLSITEPVEATGTYEEADGTVTVVISSDEGDTEMTFTVSDDALTLTEDTAVTVYRIAE